MSELFDTVCFSVAYHIGKIIGEIGKRYFCRYFNGVKKFLDYRNIIILTLSYLLNTVSYQNRVLRSANKQTLFECQYVIADMCFGMSQICLIKEKAANLLYFLDKNDVLWYGIQTRRKRNDD